jgi:broad specificity phosphatase PhoE
MTRFIVVRHGEAEWNVSGREMGQLDSPLTALGEFQAKRLAERCATTEFDALYSSDLGRAAATARAIAHECACEVIFDSRLRERNMGIFEGLTTEEMETRFPKERAEYRRLGAEYVIPSGESAKLRFERALGCLGELAERHRGETVVVVTHGGVLMGFFESVLGLPFGASRRYRRMNAAWNVFTRDSDRWLLETWGDMAHLQANEALFVPNQSKDPAP